MVVGLGVGWVMVSFAGELVPLVGSACLEAGGWVILTRLGNSALIGAVPTQRALGRGTPSTPPDPPRHVTKDYQPWA